MQGSTDANPCPNSPFVTDFDGNVYYTVQIGNQCWMRENLRTTHYADGTAIPNGGSTSSYTEAYRYCPNNDVSNVSEYGYYYNWAATMHGASSSSASPSGVQGVCPVGWHVPSLQEWTILGDYVKSQSQYMCGNNSNYIAKALASTTSWSNSSDLCAVGNDQSQNNSTGFSGLAAGCYPYRNFGTIAELWSSTNYINSSMAHNFHIDNNSAEVHCFYNLIVTNGFSVHCLRD